MSDQFDPNAPPKAARPTKGAIAATALGAGASSAAYTGAGGSGALGVVMVAHRMGMDMSVDESLVYMGLLTVVITPLLRIGQSLFRQWLAHRGYTI